MGNNNSHQTPPSTSVDVVRHPPSRPDAPPSARPVSQLGPRGPSYHSPENQVLPRELPSVVKLRPVSMELGKYNPEFQDIYAHESKENLDNNENKIEVNDELNGNIPDAEKTGSPPRPPPPVQNGHVPSGTPLSPVSQLPNGHLQTPAKSPQNSARSAGPYRPSHRRQMSLGQDHVILEEPEESIESRVKLDPLMQSFPGATGPSLPVKNNFNLDYSYQLTYVQLAEHRRNKTIEELERRTGKKVSDLSADLIEHSEKPTFIRDAPSRVSSRSSGSGVSSKKKKAPPPPGQAPPPPPMTPPTRHHPYSVDNEPPIDYDLDSPRKPSPSSVILPRYAVPPVSKVSPAVRKTSPPAPPPPMSSPRKPVVNISRTPSMSNGTPEIILRKTPDVKPTTKNVEESDGQIPWLLEIKNLSEARAARRQQSLETSETPVLQEQARDDVDKSENLSSQVEIKEDSKPKLVFESSSETLLDKLNDENTDERLDEKKGAAVERSNSLKETAKPAGAKLLRHHSAAGFDHPTATQIQRQTSEPAKPVTNDPVRRLNSLLQHDIKAAANAKCHRLVKQTTPVPPKPKDPHTVFREQLEKACAARDERVKTDGTIDDILKLNTSNASFDAENDVSETTQKYNTTPRKDKKESNVKEGPNTLPKPPRYHKNVTVNRNSSYNRVQRQNSGNQSPRDARDRQTVSMSLDWTPGDDLDSDDNLSDREVMTGRNSSFDGFKSTIIPNTMTDMKVKKKYKGKKQQKDNGPLDEQNKNKLGSVRKLKKSVHKSVKNAFGSISKASGKILRRQKSEDFEAVEDAPKNWSLTANTSGQGDHSKNFKVPLGYEQEDSDSEEEVYSHDNEFSEIVFRQNGKNDSEEESSDSTYESEDKAPQNIRRAGVAYISAKGQLVLMKDEDEIEMIEKMKTKDKKKKYKDRNASSDRSFDEVRQKERKLEEERRKQLELELDMHKKREAETRERLQRLETAHLQQQQQLLQQQQQQQQHQNLGVLSAPPLPPAGNFPNYGTLPDPARAQTQGFTNIFGQQLPQNGYQSNFGLYSQAGTYINPVTGMPYDLNDYMRILGVQAPPTSQQMAFFLNNMTLNNQPFDRKSNPVLLDMFNQQYPNGTLNYPSVDSSMKKSGFQNWASTPNISLSSAVTNSVPLGDFVASYNGANNTKTDTDENKVKSRNPLYNSDDSDGGLSPRNSIARAQVKDYRKIPVRTESGKFMKKYGSETYVSQNKQDTQNAFSDTSKSFTSIAYNEALHQKQRSVSPSNSVSTVDSAMSATSVALSTPSSPDRSTGVPASPTLVSRSQNSTPGFKTVLDLSSPEGGSMQIIS